MGPNSRNFDLRVCYDTPMTNPPFSHTHTTGNIFSEFITSYSQPLKTALPWHFRYQRVVVTMTKSLR